MCKTLKDIEAQGGAVELWELKAEAVKWVNWEILQDNDFSANGYGDTNNVQSFIKHFFNITEEIRNGK